MAIDIEKPAPLMIGDKAYYTLTSYDPVKIEVEVPATTEADIDLALATMLSQAGGTEDNLADDAWVAEHFDGTPNAAALREVVRDQVTNMNAQMAEDRKAGLCVAELAKRLRQSVPAAHIARARTLVETQFAQQLAADGLSLDELFLRTGTSPDSLGSIFDAQAKAAAEADAALDAFAHERKLTVNDGELARLLRVPATEAARMEEQARAAGQYEQLREAALRNKAAEIVVAECSCTYKHETAADAEARAAQLRALREQMAEAQSRANAKARDNADTSSADTRSKKGPDLRLV